MNVNYKLGCGMVSVRGIAWPVSMCHLMAQIRDVIFVLQSLFVYQGLFYCK